MEQASKLYLEAATTLDALIDEYINHFEFRKIRYTKDGKAFVNSYFAKKADSLIEASAMDDLDHRSVTQAVRRTMDVMVDLERICTAIVLPEYRERRKNLEKILSILHIGRTYHDDAIRRLKKLRPVIMEAA